MEEQVSVLNDEHKRLIFLKLSVLSKEEAAFKAALRTKDGLEGATLLFQSQLYDIMTLASFSTQFVALISKSSYDIELMRSRNLRTASLASGRVFQAVGRALHRSQIITL